MNHGYLETLAVVSIFLCLCGAVASALRRPRRHSATILFGSALLLTSAVILKVSHSPGTAVLLGLLGSVLLCADNTLLVAWRNR